MNYIDGIYYLTSRLYNCLKKHNITEISIIQPDIGVSDFYLTKTTISSTKLVRSLVFRICISNSFMPFVMIVVSFFWSISFLDVIIKFIIAVTFVLICIINYKNLRKMINSKFNGIIYCENKLEKFIKGQMCMEPIIVYGDKYSTLRFNNLFCNSELSKNIINLIIYLRVLFITFKQNYSIKECKNRIKDICNVIINRYDNIVILSILVYLLLSTSDHEKISKNIQYSKNNNILLTLYKKAICFFKLNCFYGDIEKYYEFKNII